MSKRRPNKWLRQPETRFASSLFPQVPFNQGVTGSNPVESTSHLGVCDGSIIISWSIQPLLLPGKHDFLIGNLILTEEIVFEADGDAYSN